MLGDLDMPKGHVDSVVKRKGLDSETIQHSVHGVMIRAPMTASLATTT